MRLIGRFASDTLPWLRLPLTTRQLLLLSNSRAPCQMGFATVKVLQVLLHSSRHDLARAMWEAGGLLTSPEDASSCSIGICSHAGYSANAIDPGCIAIADEEHWIVAG